MQVAGNGKEEINDTMSFLSAAWPLKLEEKKDAKVFLVAKAKTLFALHKIMLLKKKMIA